MARLLPLFFAAALLVITNHFSFAQDSLARLVAQEKNIRYRIDLVVRGEPVSFDRMIHCTPYVRSADWNFQIRYQPSKNVLTQRLSDGSGVIVVLPDLCFDTAELREDFVPLIVLIDDALNPTTMTLLVSRSLLLAGEYPVRLQKFQTEEINTPQPAGTQPELLQWNSDRRSVRTGTSFKGMYGLILGQEWKDSPALRAAVGTSGQVTQLPNGISQALWTEKNGRFDLFTWQNGWLPQKDIGPVNEPHDPGRAVIPFVLSRTGTFVPDLEKRGRVIFYRIGDFPGPTGATPPMPRIELDSLPQDGTPVERATYYLPNEDSIVEIGYSGQIIGGGATE